MSYTIHEIDTKLEFALQKPLPGLNAQLQLAPEGRALLDIDKLDKRKVKHAAVLALFMEHKRRPALILTKRVSYPGVHSAQMSFPGGKKEDTDNNYRETALRETHEEIGVAPEHISVKGALSPLYIPPSNFYVQPYVGILHEKQPLFPQAGEVDKIHLIDFEQLLDDTYLRYEDFQRNGLNMRVPLFMLNGEKIWGATAMMISELRSLFL